MQKFLFLIFTLLCITPIQAKNIPITEFNKMPMVAQPSVSPDGKNIATIVNSEDKTQVAIIPFNDPSKMSIIVALGGDKFRIDSIDWANNQRVLITVSQPFKAYNLQLRTSHIYSASLDGKDVIELKKRLHRKATAEEFYRNSPNLLSLLKDEPNHILVTINDIRDNNYSSVFKVDIRDSSYEKYLPNGKLITSWNVDSKGQVLMAYGIDDDRTTDKRYFYTRKDSKSDWKLIKVSEGYTTETFSPKLYDPKTNSVIVKSDYKLGKDALWRYDIVSGEYSLLGEAPGNYDIEDALFVEENGERKVVGFSYVDNYLKRVYFDKSSETLNKQVAAIFSKKSLKASLYHWNSDKTRYIISTISDTKPTQYYLFDKNNPKIVPWYGAFPGLAKEKLASVSPIQFQARDGMQLYGYLTLPNGVNNPPLIVHPHGGPYGIRDTQYFNPFVQLFASRGYAVLQVNYRGSGGYGNAYHTSGYEQWGKKMQTDLIDGLNWVKEQELANTTNACIAGGSYGGYAALAAGYQTPDLFKCIVSIAGVGDMTEQVKMWRKKGLRSYIQNAVNPNDENLQGISPQFHADKFKAPVLLIHGQVDTRVSYRQSEKMYEALQAAGKDVDYKLFKFGTHYLNDAVNRREAMDLMIDFIDEHLK
ncbi:S9 family peptidase [Psychrobium sp. MM17-31]|uniref:alpha/beta hydrolase family protein n=1 Tax=Psychrobium sp. MM17-31 TaxID=2917758 RepID=UPI001EF42954|nr:S9 family peptidase [Psychrobium sp. MM17-31]MCG7532272.1 S9 family peptidase [Psychrobium sp. MM17-31]